MADERPAIPADAATDVPVGPCELCGVYFPPDQPGATESDGAFVCGPCWTGRPAEAATDVPAIGSDGDGWYHVIFRAWGLRAPGWDSPFAREGEGDDPLYERILLAFERDTGPPPVAGGGPIPLGPEDDPADADDSPESEEMADGTHDEWTGRPTAEDDAAMEGELWDAAMDLLEGLGQPWPPKDDA